MPPFLKAGATIGIVSTARKISKDAIQPAIDTLENWAFHVKLGETIGAEAHQFAGTDDLRTKDFQAMLDDPAVDAILCAKGGYGTVRIIDQLDFTRFKENPKWIAGFSDVTVLHAHLNHVLGIPSIHCLMPGGFPENPESDYSVQTIKNSLTGNFGSITTHAHPFNKPGATFGTLVGGNLSLLYHLIGSPEDFDPVGKILFMEEVDEYLYHVDRMLWGLKRAGKFEGLHGLIVGGMTDMNDNETPFGQSTEAIIHSHMAGYEFPVCFGFPAGHGDLNQAFFLGTSIQFSVNNDGATAVWNF